MLRNTWHVVVVFVSGVMFWLPSILVHAVRRSSFGIIDLVLVNVLATAATLVTIRRLAQAFASRWPGEALLALHLLGVWLLGPVCIVASLTIERGVAETTNSLLDARMLFTPGAAFIVATYDGTLGALALVTIGLPVAILVRGIEWLWPKG